MSESETMGAKQKLLKLKQCFKNDLIYYNYYHKKIDENLVYVESREGNDFAGNVLRIVEELSSGDYGNLKIFVYAKEEAQSQIKEIQKNYDLKIAEISSNEITALKKLEIAKYVITDSGMRPRYVKRPGQIVLETWHGTPLKTMGIDNQAEEYRCANIQQVFFASDYLLYPNDYMRDKMLNAYMMEKIYPGTILLGGYPRNSIFFNRDSGEKLKDKLGFSDKQLFAYMPTFKGLFLDRKDKKQRDAVYNYLKQIDARLDDSQVLLVKLHVYNQEKIDFSSFSHIQPFPKGYETYDILNMTDCLVTDYSSVFFDYANSKRKIILFNYDEEEFLKDRGMYMSIHDLPFPKVDNVEDLMCELNCPKNYDDSEFIETFCTYDNPDACRNLCRHVFKGEKACIEEKIENDKKNILIFAGGLKSNGMTSSMINVLNKIDRQKYNIFISYSSWDPFLEENHVEAFSRIPDGVECCPLRMGINFTVLEHRKFISFLKNPNKKLSEDLIKMFKRELHRAFNGFHFDSIIHFNGYGIEETMLFSVSDSKKSIWVHNDMVQEIRGKDNQNLSVLKHVYNEYDNVVVVSPDLIKPTSQISGRKDNIRLVHNVNNIDEIKRKSQMDIEINDSCEVITNNPDGIEGVLNSPARKFITIGRFSPEKGHKRLISAFNRYCEDNPDTQLIIIGGYGPSDDQTVNLAMQSKFADNITIIKSILNPMPILKRCDLFVVSSYYEGWPMVIMEADAFDIPVIATDINGTQWMRDYGGYIVENSEEGILQGMHDFSQGKVNPLGIDYEEYNRKAIEEFLEII